MPDPIDDAFLQVGQLVDDFKANEKFYLSPQYQEAEARRDFIDKFLVALGWDVNHETQKNPYEQEVKVERKEHGVSQRRADYAFYLAPNFRDVKFYVEAKKPFGDIATPDNYFQTVRYGWNSQTPVAVLFDFEQFEIVDCRYKPNLATAIHRNLKKFHYSQYADKGAFAEIYWLFSREAVANGSLDKYAETLPKKSRGAVQRDLFGGGYQSIDESFLEELDSHRDTLARIFKNNNPELDGETLTELTQRTLDRIVFIRFLEDKQIEPQYLVSKFGERGSSWGDFIATSRRLDGIYNGIVFKKNDILDAPSFKVDDDQFSEICEALCHINSPYDFNAIPIHILGSIYERFLGKVIVATEKRARVEDKPEVRNAGGVFYTPEYIVRYIVENTVGKLIEGKKPSQIVDMRFADIACGSGSFLLGVYDLLIRYYTKYYNDEPTKAKKGDVVKREDGIHLSLQKKRDILLNNIYGVDIDTQAVEVAQLSLYLKLLQDETPGSTRQYFLDFEQQALLPSLNKNIVCGNSLIGTDILSEQLFDPLEERKLNPMDFEQRFPNILKDGGFDVVLGNPPYVRMESFKHIKHYLKSHYAAHEERADFYTYFLERALSLLNPRGYLSMIVSNKFAVAKYGHPLRKALENKALITELTDFAGVPVFRGATVRTFVLFAQPKLNNINVKTRYIPVPDLDTFKQMEKGTLSVSEYAQNNETFMADGQLTSAPWQLLPAIQSHLLKRLSEDFPSLSDAFGWKPLFGIKTGLNDAFVVDDEEYKKLTQSDETSKKALRPFLFGRDVKSYNIEDVGRYVIYLHPDKHPKDYPAIKRHLEQFKSDLVKRAASQEWYELQQPAVSLLPLLNKPKIIYPIIAPKPRFALDNKGFLINDKLFVLPSDSLYLLGLLNSALANFFFSSVCARLEGTGECYYEYRAQYVERFPTRKIDLSRANEKAIHDKVVSLAEQMLSAKKHHADAKSDKDKDFYENKCATLERQIDELVYKLYDLTNDEIQIVEAAK